MNAVKAAEQLSEVNKLINTGPFTMKDGQPSNEALMTAIGIFLSDWDSDMEGADIIETLLAKGDCEEVMVKATYEHLPKDHIVELIEDAAVNIQIVINSSRSHFLDKLLELK